MKPQKKSIYQKLSGAGITLRILAYGGVSLLISSIILSLLQNLRVSETILLIFALMSAVLVFFYLYLRTLIIKPLLEIIKITDSISHGHLGRRIEIKRHDEIGQLAATINTMTDSLQHRLSQLSTLCEISRDSTSSLSLDSILKSILAKAVNFHQADSGSIMLVDKKNEELVIEASVNMDAGIVKNTRNKIGSGIAGWVAKEGKPLLLMDGVTFHGNQDLKDAVSIPIKLHDHVLGVLNLNNKRDKSHTFNTKDLDFLTALANQAASVINNAQLFDQLKKNYLSIIQALAAAIDAKDPYTCGHSARVAGYAVAIAKELGLSAEDIDNIKAAAYLHDVGKIGIPEHILSKPDKLTDEEFEIIKTHPEISARILKPVQFQGPVIPAVRHHHERFNGTGYPDRLSGENIPPAARILAVADSFDAMISNRPYRSSRDVNWAREELKRCAGSQFDPRVVAAFLTYINRLDAPIVAETTKISESV